MSKLDEIIAFVEVVNVGSITKAAERLGIVKSAVSKRLTDLENRLQARLLVRSTAGISVTEVGRSFFERASVIISELNDAEMTVTDASANLFGTIKLSAPVSLTNLLLMPHLGAFLRKHPQLQIDMSLSDRFVDIVNEGFDLAIRAGTLVDSRLVARKLTDLSRITCASPEYLQIYGTPKTPMELHAFDGLVSTNSPESVYWNYELPSGEKYLAKPSTRFKANNGEAVITAAIAGLGVAAVPAFMSEEGIKKGLLCPILTDYKLVSGSLYAIYPPGRHLSHRIRVLIDFLVSRFANVA